MSAGFRQERVEFSAVEPMAPGGRCREAHGMTARADLCHQLTSTYASSEALFPHPPSQLHLLPPRKARGAFQFIFRFRYCSLVAGIRHATYSGVFGKWDSELAKPHI